MADLRANLDVNLTVTPPPTIDVPLARGDYLRVSGGYRAAFDVMFGLFAAGGGAALGGANLGKFGMPFLVLTGVGAAVALIVSIVWRRRSVVQE